MLSKAAHFRSFLLRSTMTNRKLRRTTRYCTCFHLVKNLLGKTVNVQYLLLAVVLPLVEFWVSGFGLVSFSKYLLISCFSLPFPLTEYCYQMLKVVSLQGVTSISFLLPPIVTVLRDVIEELKCKTSIF